MKQPLRSGDYRILGTLKGPGDFQWAVEPQSLSAEARQEIEDFCNDYRVPKKDVTELPCGL